MRRLAVSLVLVCALHGQGLAQGMPLSAIDWLSDTIARPPETQPGEGGFGVTAPGQPETITTTPLAERNLDAVGVLPPEVTGLDRRLWAASSVAVLGERIRAERPEAVPALRDLLQTLMLAELDPPADASGAGDFLLVRIDKLLELGALEAADALAAASGPPTPDLFRRSFDIALLLGTEDAACERQRALPGLTPTFSARVFCMARGGDWQAAELVLNTARALGQITAEEDAMLQRFIAPELYEDEAPLSVPERLSPLVLRMLEAIGEPVSSTGLPLAFAHGDLTPATGWKARLEAAERLARAGAIAPGQLFEIYSERMPAASGGVWERVEAVQRFETALAAGDPGAVGASLPRVWSGMAAVELEVPFAETHAAALQRLPLTGPQGQLAFRIALLGRDYEAAAQARVPADDDEAFLIGLARGSLAVPSPPEALARAIAPVFAAGGSLPPPSPQAGALLDEARLGEATLWAMDKVMAGVTGDLRGVTEGLALLRRMGLEGTARRAALQLMILERRG